VKGKTNLDGLAWKTGRLVIGVFEDDRPGGASEFLEIVGLPIGELVRKGMISAGHFNCH